jgi:hypothetical protein
MNFGMVNKQMLQSLTVITPSKKESKQKLNAVQRAKETKELLLRGELRVFPFNWKIFNNVVPGMILEPVIITGISSSGKSSFTKFLYLQLAIKHAIENNIPYKVIFFALEDTYEIIENGLLCHLYWNKYKEIIDIKLLDGLKFNHLGKEVIMTDLQIQRLENLSPELEKYMSYVKVYDDVYTGQDIWKTCQDYAIQNGTFYKEGVSLTTNQVITGEWDEYVQNKKEFVAVVVDNINLLDTCEEEKTLYESMVNMSSKYCKKYIIKGLKYHCVLVAQQSEESSSLDHKKAGEVLASERGISEAKRICKDARIVIGVNYLFKLSQKSFLGYDLELMRGFHRAINIIKNTYGGMAVFSCLFIPHVNQWIMLDRLKKGESVPAETQELIEKTLMLIRDYEEN